VGDGDGDAALALLGALSIVSKARYSAWPFRPRYLVMAAVSEVLPWSMWPIVPMLTCGLVRSNFFLAISRRFLSSPLDLRLLGELAGDALTAPPRSD
jgi:hypothetical protein